MFIEISNTTKGHHHHHLYNVCSVLWGVLSTVGCSVPWGHHEYHGGHIMSTMGGHFEYRGRTF